MEWKWMRDRETESEIVVLLPLALAVTNEVTWSSKTTAHQQVLLGTLGY